MKKLANSSSPMGVDGGGGVVCVVQSYGKFVLCTCKYPCLEKLAAFGT